MRFVDWKFGPRRIGGALVYDLPRYFPRLAGGKRSYLAICNRRERLVPAPDRTGFRCDWRWTSDLYAPKVFPWLGLWLMKRALADHPVEQAPQPAPRPGGPDIAFIIGHRGSGRLPHLLATLESIAGQRDVAVECVVVEQETESLLAGRLPAWVRHIHTPPPKTDMPYCRSWAFNVGVNQARAEVMILHDNDMLVPRDYAAQVLSRIGLGYEVVNLMRFVFYLGAMHTQGLLAGRTGIFARAPEVIVQNLEGGGTVAITREAFERIGGMDESFIGWGGEDNEFWERAQTCKVWPYGCLPIVHLWHPSQPGKIPGSARNSERYLSLSRVPVMERIQALRNSPGGMPGGLSVHRPPPAADA